MDISKKLKREIKRKKKIVKYLKSRAGKNSTVAFENLIRTGEKAIQDQDNGQMFLVYKELKDIE